ncbi:MAG: flagellar basal-body rod protein FlgF [Gammaproteobacteria bacterium]|nr:flagellar basal-body rod protein FlgF [Gammaproteobacteria bacterium]
MDRSLYVAMTGAQQTMLAQAANNNNIANVSTPGFRADLAQFRSMPLFGPGYPSRVYAMAERSGTDFTPGPINATGNPMDVAINGDGWLVVQASNGKEAYTRAGNLHIDEGGRLVSANGRSVMGEGGPIAVPPASKIEIAEDGTVTILPLGESAKEMTVVDRIKLVKPNHGDLQKDVDGLMYLKSGKPAPADASVKLVPGTLEGSNVNMAQAMVSMIELARQYEMQIKLMREAEQNADATRQLLQMS